jgi:hypothetical protein
MSIVNVYNLGECLEAFARCKVNFYCGRRCIERWDRRDPETDKKLFPFDRRDALP